MSLDDEWMNFQYAEYNNINTNNDIPENSQSIKNENIPKCSDIYISTQTKIAYLNSTIDLYDIFWALPITEYHNPVNGIIKKSIKINCNNEEEVKELENKIQNTKNIDVCILSKVNNPNARKVKFKDIRKIDIGLSKKDMISYRKKKKGAFYNCFAVILRILYNNEYKEVHVKIFNTGKLEIPGIQYDDLLNITLDKLVSILKPLTNKELDYNKENISTVLINSNFSCGFYIDRFKLYKILKHKYGISAAYDPCSYPGIQSKFYYHPEKLEQNGIKNNTYKEGWTQISFMVFRTGSVLIVGNCDKNILNKIYIFLKDILREEYSEICLKNNTTKKKLAVKKVRKKTILLSIK
tara:strand:- start:7920 stop:8975 length:1056 start_codon:yes stop_codon:yes gene_type:complete